MSINKKNLVDPSKVLPDLSLGDAIETIRLDLEISKVEMAEKLGLSKAHYGNIVSGIESVSIKRAAEWAKILKHPEKLFVQYALQDLIKRNNFDYKVGLA